MEATKKLSVSQLSGYIKSVFDDELILHNICVYGELSQLSIRENVSYFTITEGGCYINCGMFSKVENIEVGTLVQIYGSVSFYTKSGKTNFTAKNIVSIGKGSLGDELKKLTERLKNEGLFVSRPKPPIYIGKVAVITSEAGAVIHDIMRVLRDKCVNVDLRLFPAAVQGANAEHTLIEALDSVNEGNYDVVLIARGGGSAYDLDVFNSEKLARAVAESSVPVISAIGHETDYTLCDYCAGVRAGTPSIAAATIADINLDFLARFHTALQKIDMGLIRIYERLTANAYRNASSVIHAMDKKVAANLWRINAASDKLTTSLQRIPEHLQKKLLLVSKSISDKIDDLEKYSDISVGNTIARLESASPLKALARGYAKVLGAKKDVTSVTELKKDDTVVICFSDGKAEAIIKNIKEHSHEPRRKP